MILQFGEVSLTKLTKEDIELVRTWRNDPKIQQHMYFQEHISKEQQKDWFNKLSKEEDYYFIIKHKNEKIGVNHINKIDTKSKVGSAGLFIFNESYWGTPIPIIASLALLQFAFEQLELKKVLAITRKENENAKQYNSFLGFEAITDNEFELTIQRYSTYTLALTQKINALFSS